MATTDLNENTKRPVTGAAHDRPASERFTEQAGAVSKGIQGMGTLARDVAHEKLEELQENTSAVYGQGQDQVRATARSLERFIAEQPLTSVLVAAGVGLILGRFWMRP